LLRRNVVDIVGVWRRWASIPGHDHERDALGGLARRWPTPGSCGERELRLARSERFPSSVAGEPPVVLEAMTQPKRPASSAQGQHGAVGASTTTGRVFAEFGRRTAARCASSSSCPSMPRAHGTAAPLCPPRRARAHPCALAIEPVEAREIRRRPPATLHRRFGEIGSSRASRARSAAPVTACASRPTARCATASFDDEASLRDILRSVARTGTWNCCSGARCGASFRPRINDPGFLRPSARCR